MNIIAIVVTAIGTVIALALIKSPLWSRARTDRAVQVYAWLFSVQALIWAVGTAIYFAAPRFITQLLASASQFQAMMLTMLIVCFVVLVTMSIRAAR